MVEAWLQRRFVSRNAILGVVACLCVLQGLILAVSPHGRFAGGLHADSGVVAFMDGALCGADMQGDGETPTPRGHSQCCVLCMSNAHAGLLRFAAALFDIVAFPTPRFGAAIAWRFSDDPIAPLAGWASSWSSRAPPSFS